MSIHVLQKEGNGAEIAEPPVLLQPYALEALRGRLGSLCGLDLVRNEALHIVQQQHFEWPLVVLVLPKLSRLRF